MSIGMVLLTVAAIFVFFGVAQRVLDRMYLTDRMALILIAMMFFGTLLPNLKFGLFEISIGGGLIPLGICAYLLIRAGTNKERIRALLGSVVTGAIVYAVSALILPDEPEQLPFDPMYLNGVVAGIVAYAFGRSRRGAFICGVLGVMLADITVAILNQMNGVQQTLIIGGAGAFDAMVIAGLLAVVLAEAIGETLERVTRGKKVPAHSSIKPPTKGRVK
ncbi:MAG: DUF1614 domain-containing protein [Clostridia bacterium]|nr:DUF1614 domain-containing protein [Clostridia bacterium]